MVGAAQLFFTTGQRRSPQGMRCLEQALHGDGCGFDLLRRVRRKAHHDAALLDGCDAEPVDRRERHALLRGGAAQRVGVDFPGPCQGLALYAVDPGGKISEKIPLDSIVGSVIFPNCEKREPGVSQHNFGNRIILGEPSRRLTNRVEKLVSLFSQAGLDAHLSQDIHSDIWNKAVGNMVMNPVSALTGATCDRILDDPDLRNFCLCVMRQAVDIGKKIGCDNLFSADEQMQLTRKMGKFKTSMLQDMEAGRRLEIDSLIGVVSEIGRAIHADTDRIDSLLGLVRVFGLARGLYASHA
ncbi:2-dehydropantoate 2-reductase [Verminephrobacter aporrectodeae subsp. tuberculatae]|nr:2-dehydropantoate 2-reductase [Verminephrobacter aporrectodeae subsp. tuberculatae]